ncbi:cell division protein SepF [uncultured Pseudokineococcus sp.]|uniref:cell division protein SepF n=1 Tax=uncultured Pseudokineococcus sp. TaxID=1642928 RepID=UPI002635AD12|nr:cell division protein SepF [uncultured Pseudokineococcus sp.]
MAGALRRTMVYLGLAEEDPREDELDAYEGEERRDEREPQRSVERAGAHRAPERTTDHEPRSEHRAAVTPITRERSMSRVVPEPLGGDLSRITTIHPRSYNEAKAIGESFRESVPVIMNLTDMDDADAKRLVDFSAGLVFGLRGSIERVTSKVFLLSPAHVEVTAEQATPQRTGTSSSFFNQS